ncbi:hypothetical protein GvMRE_I1g735 [endosymbiont GvMRE of Glomus versiforme]|nr:hypothetical protein GvMRE_I1g735 [endosymbiont GvMRE of Glomus versiforme]
MRKVSHALFLKGFFFSFWDKSIKRQIQIPILIRKDKNPIVKRIIHFTRG